MQQYLSLFKLLFDYGPFLFAKRVQMALSLKAWDQLADIDHSDALNESAATQPQPYDIVIPVYGDVTIVAPLLKRLQKSPPQHACRIIIIDDGSQNDALTQALEAFVCQAANGHLITHHNNQGFSAAVTTGIAASDQPLVLVINSDTVPPKGSLDRLMAHFSIQPTLGAICPLSNQAIFAGVTNAKRGKVMVPDDIDRLNEAISSRPLAMSSYQVPYACGFCWGVRRPVWDQLGGFDAAFASGYGEEADFCLRALSAGYESRVASDCAVFHAHGQSFQSARIMKERRATMELLKKHPQLGSLIASDKLLALANSARQQKLSTAKAS